jgi:hypothetical protein
MVRGAFIILTITIALIFLLVNPAHISTLVLLAVFFIIIFTLACGIYSLLDFLKLGHGGRRKTLAITISFALTLAILLKSIGELNLKDGIALFGLLLIGNFYIKRNPYLQKDKGISGGRSVS